MTVTDVKPWAEQVELATRKIEKALFQIRSRRDLAGYGPILNRIRKYKAATWCPTMGTDGQTMYFSPSFVLRISQGFLRLVMVHEAGHVLYAHHLRLKGESLNPYVANIAFDHRINNDICMMPAFREGFLERPPKEFKWFCDPDFQDADQWNSERIYREIIKDFPPPPPQPQCSSGKAGDGKGDNPSPGSGKPQDDDDDSGDDQGQGQGQGQQQPQGGDGSGGGQQRQDMNGPDQIFGEVYAPPPEVDPEQEKDDLAQELSRAKFIEKSLGLNPGTTSVLDNVFAERNHDVGDWSILEDLVQTATSPDRTWSKQNLVFWDHGYLPGRKKTTGTVHVAFDVSGSMSESELKACFDNSAEIVERLKLQTLKCAYIDMRIIEVNDGEAWEEFDVAAGEEPEYRITGRGGTTFAPIFHRIEEEGEEVDVLIYFTDAEGYCHLAEAPPFPVIWAITTDRDDIMGYGACGKFGEVVHIKAERDYGFGY